MTNSDIVSLRTGGEKYVLTAEGLSFYIGLVGGPLSGLGINHLAREHIIDHDRYVQSKGSGEDVETGHQIYREIGKAFDVCTGYGTQREYCYSFGSVFTGKTPDQVLQKLGDVERIFSENKEFLGKSQYFPEAQNRLTQATTYIENNFRAGWPRNADSWHSWLYSGGGDRIVRAQELRQFLAVTEASKHELTYLTNYANTSDVGTTASFVIGGILSGIVIGLVSSMLLKKVARHIVSRSESRVPYA